MICDRNSCTGCFACYNACPMNAINMKEDEFGYIYPEIDKSMCIECEICQKVCPSLKRVNFNYPKKCYAMCSKDENIRSKSTSGGIATVFATHIINQGGIVYGAGLDDDGIVKHMRVDNIVDLDKLKGSKYVHSYIYEIFARVKEDLMCEETVLFVGTPCQIAGLKNFLEIECINCKKLYLIDLVCHGVPSQQFLKDELNNEIGNCKIDKISFRDDDGFNIKISKDNKILYRREESSSPFYNGFLNALFYRENCYNCIYARPERVSDMTIGDFWGLGHDSKFYNDKDKGVSVCLPITNKGIHLIEECKEKIIMEERDIKEAIKGNAQLKKPVQKNKRTRKIY